MSVAIGSSLELLLQKYGVWEILTEWECGQWGPVPKGTLDFIIEQSCRYSPEAEVQIRRAVPGNREYPISRDRTTFPCITAKDGAKITLMSVSRRNGELQVSASVHQKSLGTSTETFTIGELQQRIGKPSIIDRFLFFLKSY